MPHYRPHTPDRSNNATMRVDETQSPISIPTTGPPPSNPEPNQINSTAKHKNNEQTQHINPPSPTLPAQPQALILNPPQPDLPTFPPPAILRPRLASLTSCHVEILNASGKMVPAADTKKLRWKFFWRLPGELLRFLIRDSGWR